MTATAGFDSLEREVRGGVCYLTFNRPHALNAIDVATKLDLAIAVREFDEDDAQRVLIVTGSDCGAFSTGSDLKERGIELDGSPLPKSVPYCDTIASSTKPVIAAIDGYCVGGGLELALACDVRFATKRSSFGLPEARIGTLGHHGVNVLSRTIPLGESLLIHLTGGRMDAQRAYEIGLIQGLVDDRTALFAKVGEVAADIERCSPTAVKTLKYLVMNGRELPVASADLLSKPYRDQIHYSAEAAEGARAFREKRPANWNVVGPPS
jgi:enoyl-CoA hydratase/carnithine racemase